MKKLSHLSLFIVSLCSLLNVTAQQIVNGDMEYWDNVNNSDKQHPIDWSTRNHVDDNPQAVYCIPVNDAYSGDKAIMLQNFQPTPSTSLASYISLGQFNPNKPKHRGIAFNSRPVSLNFAYKYFTTDQNPTGFFESKAVLRLTKWDDVSATSILIGKAEYSIIHKANFYLLVEENIEYFESKTPDSLFLSFSTPGNPNDQVRLTLDNIHLKFEITAGIDEPFYFDEIRVFPNPASSIINIFSPTIKANSKLLIYDALGRLHATHDLIDNNQQINIDGLEEGFYFYQIRSENNLIKTGKFLKSVI